MKKSIIVFIVTLLAFSLFACGAAPGPSDSVKREIDNLKSGSSELPKDTFDDVIIVDGLDDATNALMQKMKDFDYEIVEEKIAEDGESAEVKVKVTTYGFGEVFSDSMEELITVAFMAAFGEESEDSISEYYKTLLDRMTSLTNKDYSKTVTVKVNKNDNDWVVDLKRNDEFIDAMSGGMFSVIEMLESLGSDAAAQETEQSNVSSTNYTTIGSLKDNPLEVTTNDIKVQYYSAYCKSYSDNVLAYRITNNSKEDKFLGLEYGFYDETGQGYVSEGDIAYIPSGGSCVFLGQEIECPDNWFVYGEVLEFEGSEKDIAKSKGFTHNEYINGNVVSCTLEFPSDVPDIYCLYYLAYVDDNDKILAMDMTNLQGDNDAFSDTFEIPDVPYTRIEASSIDGDLYNLAKW